MPCRDHYTDDVRYVENPINQELKDRLDKVTKLLCFVMGNINDDPWYKGVLYNWEFQRGNDDLEIEVLQWWEEHQRLDEEAKRKEEELELEQRKLIMLRAKLNSIFDDEDRELIRDNNLI